jgi:hypothetical protein
MQLFYLDNLDCGLFIDPFAIPRPKYFHKSVTEKLIHQDRRRDRSGNVTYGNLQVFSHFHYNGILFYWTNHWISISLNFVCLFYLQLKNIADTCYRVTEPDRSRVSAAANSSSIPMFPHAEQLGVVLNEIDGSSSRNKATGCLQKFATKASEAIDVIQSGSNMLVDAHKEFVCTMQSVLGIDPAENRGEDEYPSTQ